MVKEVEELIKIVGKGNLLEMLFIFLGSFQHANLDYRIDHRNHIDLSEFINKKERESLDKYLNLQFSLQGLFLIYVQAYRILAENAQFNTQEVIDTIYAAVESGRISTTYNALGELLREIVDQAELTEDQKKLKLLNILANPKGETLFNNNNDFEKQVLNNVKKLLKISYANKFDKEFSLYKEVINYYYSIHKDIKIDKDVVLLFSILGDYHKLSEHHKESIKKGSLPIIDNVVVSTYIMNLTGLLQSINLKDQNRATKYTLNREKIGSLNRTFNILADQNNQNFPTFKSIGPTLKQLLKKQDSNKFEERIINNTYCLAPQEENECRPNLIISKKKEKDHKNTVCKLILGVFVLSVGLYAADYFLMKQKLFNSITNILPQTNLIIAAVLTIVVVYALFQLLKSPQEPPLSTVDDVQNKKLEPLHAKQA